MNKPPYYVGLDVGGSTMKAGVVDDHGRPRSAVSLPTEAYKGQQFGLDRMCETIQLAIAEASLDVASIQAIGVATPGTMDIPAGLILDPPNLRPWQNVPVRSHVQSVFRLPTGFQNDANAAALGEYWAGAGKGARSMVLFTLGTGIGAGIVINGWVLQGEHSHGAELGHTVVETSHPRTCPCGRLGCVEAYASATSVVKRTREALENDGGKSKLHSVVRQQGSLSCRDVFLFAEADELARRIVDETAYYLGVAAVNAMHTIDPDMVVFGGGMTAAGPSFLERIRHHVQSMAFPVCAANTRVEYSCLGNDGGFIGAAACGRQLLHRPSLA